MEKSLTSFVACAILVLLCLAGYQHSLNGDFVFDDTVAIVKNSDVTGKNTNLSGIFRHHDFWGTSISSNESHKSYRPLTTLMFHMEYAHLGFRSKEMKVVNIIIHCINTLLFWQLLTKLRLNYEFQVATIAAALFALHPVHVEAVSGIVGRADLMFCLLNLLALLTSSNKSLYSDVLIVLMTGVAILFKETAVTIPLACVFLSYIKHGIYTLEWHLQIKHILNRRTIALGFATVIFIIMRLWIQDFAVPHFKLMDNPIAYNANPFTKILSQQYLYAINFWILLSPQWLCFDWALGCIELITSIWDLRLQAVLALYSFMTLIILNGKQNVVAILSLGLMIIPFLPASGIVKVGFVIAERVLYVPSLGFCLLIAHSFTHLLHLAKNEWLRSLLKLMLMLVFLCFLIKTRERASEWKTEENLFESALKVCPKNAKVHYNIARLASEKRENVKAMKYYHNAIQLYPEYEAALMNLGNLYREVGDFLTAEKYIKASLDVYPEFASAWMNLGIVQAAQKKYADASESYKNALKYRKNYATCYYNLGNLFLDQKRYTEAMQNWQEAVTLNPRQPKAWANILTMLDNRGLYEDGLRLSEQALKHLPHETGLMFIRANIFGKLKHYVEAETLYKYILKLEPNNVLYQTNLAILYHRWGKLEIAALSYRKAISIDPKKAKTAIDNLEKLLKRLEQ